MRYLVHAIQHNENFMRIHLNVNGDKSVAFVPHIVKRKAICKLCMKLEIAGSVGEPHTDYLHKQYMKINRNCGCVADGVQAASVPGRLFCESSFWWVGPDTECIWLMDPCMCFFHPWKKKSNFIVGIGRRKKWQFFDIVEKSILSSHILTVFQ